MATSLTPSELGRAMVRERWKRTTHEQRQAHIAMMNAARAKKRKQAREATADEA